MEMNFVNKIRMKILKIIINVDLQKKKNMMIIIEKIVIHVDMKDEEMIIIVKMNQHHDININQSL